MILYVRTRRPSTVLVQYGDCDAGGARADVNNVVTVTLVRVHITHQIDHFIVVGVSVHTGVSKTKAVFIHYFLMTRDEHYDGDSEPVICSVNLPAEQRRPDGLNNNSVTIVHASDDEFSASALSMEEASSMSGILLPDSPRKESAAIQMATMQASFAEKTAEEMKQIVDWYSTNNETDRFTKVTQSRSLPDNPLACLDDEEEEMNGSRTPQRTNRTIRRGDASENMDKSAGVHTPKTRGVFPGEENNSSSTVDGLPDLTTSPTMAESPVSVQLDGANTTSISSSREAQEQHQVVKDLLEATQYMASIVLEYEQSSSASDREVSKQTGTTTRRRRRPQTSLESAPHPSEMLPDRASFKVKKRKRRLNKKLRRSLTMIGVGMALFIAWMVLIRGRMLHSSTNLPLNTGTPMMGDSSEKDRDIMSATPAAQNSGPSLSQCQELGNGERDDAPEQCHQAKDMEHRQQHVELLAN
jgi:hypothetical protein